MKKVSITLGVVFFIFILCSLTYQPIIADESNELSNIKMVNTYHKKFENMDMRTVIHLLFKSQRTRNDCGCEYDLKGLWPFPMFCFILYVISELSLRFGMSIAGPPPLHIASSIIAMTLGCKWVYPI